MKANNNQKIREALEWCRDFMRDIYDGKEGVKFSADDIERINSALAAPPRNCDLYKTESKAYQAWLKEMMKVPIEARVYFESWLFAEAKGANDEQ